MASGFKLMLVFLVTNDSAEDWGLGSEHPPHALMGMGFLSGHRRGKSKTQT